MTEAKALVRRPPWVWIGVVSGVFLLPVVHFGAVDLESTNPDQFLQQATDRFSSITAGGTLGLLVCAMVIVALLGIRTLAPARRHLLADALTAVGLLGVVGLVLSFTGSLLAAYAAHQGYPYEVVRVFGILADGAAPILSGFFSGTALLLAIVSIRDQAIPRALGWVSACFALVIAGLGLVAPGGALLPAIVWYAVATIWLAVGGVSGRPAP